MLVRRQDQLIANKRNSAKSSRPKGGKINTAQFLARILCQVIQRPLHLQFGQIQYFFFSSHSSLLTITMDIIVPSARMQTKDVSITESVVGVTTPPTPQDFPSGNHSLSKNSITITFDENGDYEVNGTKQDSLISSVVTSSTSKLRRLLKDTNDLIVCPGVYDGLSARVAIELGFKAMYMV